MKILEHTLKLIKISNRVFIDIQRCNKKKFTILITVKHWNREEVVELRVYLSSFVVVVQNAHKRRWRTQNPNHTSIQKMH